MFVWILVIVSVLASCVFMMHANTLGKYLTSQTLDNLYNLLDSYTVHLLQRDKY